MREVKQTKARIGFTPFLAEYTELNIWWIAQFEKYDVQENIEAKQFLRFYIKNVLWEMGSDFNGNMGFNASELLFYELFMPTSRQFYSSLRRPPIKISCGIVINSGRSVNISGEPIREDLEF